MPSLEDIITDCKRFDRKAQKVLYDKYAPLMKSICVRYLGYSDDLQDVIQDGFIKVFMKITSFEGKGSFEGWLKRVFINTAIKHLQKNKRKFIEIDYVTHTDLNKNIENTTENNYIDDASHSSIGRYDAINLADLSENEIFSVIQQIPENYRLVFNLHCFEEYSHEEIAEMLKIEVTTSRTRLLRAREFLKKELYEKSLSKLRSSNE